MKQKPIFIFLLIVLAMVAGIGFMQLVNNQTGKRMPTLDEISNFDNITPSPQSSIAELTNENVVINYLKTHQKLPDYYLTKNEARKLGWIPSEGNLCEKLPGKAIGGDYFGNREGQLPKQKGRKYFEADINYNCGRRDAERLIYSNDGLIFITKDHYKTFKAQ